jgi:heptaprenyl diphosphate synthase
VTLQILTSNNPADAKLKQVLSSPVPETEIASVIKELRSHRALNEAKRYLHNLAGESKSILTSLPNGAARETLERLCDAIVDRTA